MRDKAPTKWRVIASSAAMGSATWVGSLWTSTTATGLREGAGLMTAQISARWVDRAPK
jgi:hypothetical protein